MFGEVWIRIDINNIVIERSLLRLDVRKIVIMSTLLSTSLLVYYIEEVLPSDFVFSVLKTVRMLTKSKFLCRLYIGYNIFFH